MSFSPVFFPLDRLLFIGEGTFNVSSFGGGGGLLSLGLQNILASSFTLDVTAAVFMSSCCTVGVGLSSFLEVISAS